MSDDLRARTTCRELHFWESIVSVLRKLLFDCGHLEQVCTICLTIHWFILLTQLFSCPPCPVSNLPRNKAPRKSTFRTRISGRSVCWKSRHPVYPSNHRLFHVFAITGNYSPAEIQPGGFITQEIGKVDYPSRCNCVRRAMISLFKRDTPRILSYGAGSDNKFPRCVPPIKGSVSRAPRSL